MSPEASAPRILVVEDDDLTRAYLIDLIESFGYPVIAAENGMEAMRAIAQSPTLELVFTDIAMPGVGGIVLADMVKQHRPKLKILYATGGRGVEQIKGEAGILHGNILNKPFKPDELKAELESLLG